MRGYFLINLAGLAIASLVAVFGTVPLFFGKGVWHKTGSSLLLFLSVAFGVLIAGAHMCDEGGSPPFVILSTAAVCSAMPWLALKNAWLTRIAIAVVLMSGMAAAHNLADSYHAENITGNPEYSSGRFWHTPFSGQYPRAKTATGERVQRRNEKDADRQEAP